MLRTVNGSVETYGAINKITTYKILSFKRNSIGRKTSQETRSIANLCILNLRITEDYDGDFTAFLKYHSVKMKLPSLWSATLNNKHF